MPTPVLKKVIEICPESRFSVIACSSLFGSLVMSRMTFGKRRR